MIAVPSDAGASNPTTLIQNLECFSKLMIAKSWPVDRVGQTVGSFAVGSTDYDTQSGSQEILAVGQNRLFDVVMVWHVLDWAEQSGN